MTEQDGATAIKNAENLEGDGKDQCVHLVCCFQEFLEAQSAHDSDRVLHFCSLFVKSCNVLFLCEESTKLDDTVSLCEICWSAFLLSLRFLGNQNM